MKIEDINAVSSELGEGLVEGCLQLLWTVHARFDRVAFSCDGETLVGVFGLSGESFLLTTNVHAGGIDFGVAIGQEVVEAGVVFV